MQFFPDHLDDKLGLVLLLIGIALAQDLIVHKVGISYCIDLVQFDQHLALGAGGYGDWIGARVYRDFALADSGEKSQNYSFLQISSDLVKQ